MFIKSTDLSNAMSYIGVIAALDKTQPGILFDIKENEVDIYYNSGSRAIITTVSAVVDAEKDILGKVVFDYKRMTDTLSCCKASGSIKIDNVEFILNRNPSGPGTAKVNVVKMIDQDDGKGGVTEAVVANNSYELAWWDESNISMSQKLLLNPACDNMFNEADAQVFEETDLNNMISEACSGDAKVVYFSPKYNGVFAVNTASNVLVKSEGKVDKIIPLQTNAAKAMISVFHSIPTKEVYVNTMLDDKGRPFACLMFNMDAKISIYMAASLITGTHLTSIGRYNGMGYDTYQINLGTEILKDTLKSVVSLSGPNGTIEFVNGESGVEAVITAENTGASVSNTYRIRCYSFNTLGSKPETSETWLKLPINNKLILDILANNKNELTAFDIQEENGAYFLRIGYVDKEKAKEVVAKYKKDNHIDDKEKLSIEAKLALRGDYLMTNYFVAVKGN